MHEKREGHVKLLDGFNPDQSLRMLILKTKLDFLEYPQIRFVTFDGEP